MRNSVKELKIPTSVNRQEIVVRFRAGVDPKQVRFAVTAHFGYTPEQLEEKDKLTRNYRLKRARIVAMLLTHVVCGRSPAELAVMFGQAVNEEIVVEGHTVVIRTVTCEHDIIFMCRSAENALAYQEDLQNDIAAIAGRLSQSA